MTDIFIYTLQRGGNSYIINWVLNNLSHNNISKFKRWHWGKYGEGSFSKEYGIIHARNDHNMFESKDPNGRKVVTYTHGPAVKYTVISIENAELDKVYPYIIKNRDQKRKIINIIVLRDIANLLASRQECDGALDDPKAPVEVKPLYLSFCNEILNKTNILDHKVVILYNKHITDKKYRDEIARKLDIKNYDLIKVINNTTKHSSFNHVGSYNKRYLNFSYNEKYKTILKDSKIIDYTKELFDIDVTQEILLNRI